MMKPLSLAGLSSLCLSLASCVSVQTYRASEPVALPSGEATSACEREAWVELVPTTVSAQAPGSNTSSDGAYIYSQSYTAHRSAKGLSVYALDTDQPLPLAELLPKLDEPALAKRHFARVEPLQRRESISEAFNLSSYVSMSVGLVGVFVGLGMMLSRPYDYEPTSALDDGMIVMLASSGVVALGSLLLVPGYFIKPDPYELTMLRTRELTFLPHENDLDAVKRGVDRLNQQSRARCAAR